MGWFALPEQKPAGLDRPSTVRIIKVMARAHTVLFKATNGRLGRSWRIGAGFRKPVPTLLLEHVGRKSGTAYTTPLAYMTDGEDLIVVGSQGGLPKDPQWVANLVAHPDTHVVLPRLGRRPVHARRAEADHDRLWQVAVAAYADFDKYQQWTQRRIPIVVLEPRV